MELRFTGQSKKFNKISSQGLLPKKDQYANDAILKLLAFLKISLPLTEKFRKQECVITKEELFQDEN